MRRKTLIAAIAVIVLLPALTSCKKCLTCQCNNYYDFTWDKNWEGTYTDEEREVEEQKVITEMDLLHPESRLEDCGKKKDLVDQQEDWVKADTTILKDQGIFEYTVDHSCTCVINKP